MSNCQGTLTSFVIFKVIHAFKALAYPLFLESVWMTIVMIMTSLRRGSSDVIDKTFALHARTLSTCPCNYLFDSFVDYGLQLTLDDFCQENAKDAKSCNGRFHARIGLQKGRKYGCFCATDLSHDSNFNFGPGNYTASEILGDLANPYN